MWAKPAGNSPDCPNRSYDERAFLNAEGPLHLLADWVEAVFLNYQIRPESLQRYVPYELDLCEGSEWVSLVAFTMRDMRPAKTGLIGRSVFLPFREQRFLNVRTYVRHNGIQGIHFIVEWVSDWVNAQLGPLVYGLPYRYGHLTYTREQNRLGGRIIWTGGELIFNGDAAVAKCRPVEAAEAAEFLLERYFAFNSIAGKRRFFRVWHEPWLQTEASVRIEGDTLMRSTFPWWKEARFFDGRFSTGVSDVRMGLPRRVLSGSATHGEQ